MSKKSRAARRADVSGLGPTVNDRRPGLNPGAAARVAMFGDVMLTGIMITVASIPVVTLPVALAAGIRHLRAYAAGESSTWRAYWSDVRAGLLGGIGVGFAAVAMMLVFIADIGLAATGILPAAPAVAAVGWIGVAGLALAVLVAAEAWTPDAGWRTALRAVTPTLRRDLRGAVYRLIALALFATLTWVLPPLAIPGLGVLAFSAVALSLRPARLAADRGRRTARSPQPQRN